MLNISPFSKNCGAVIDGIQLAGISEDDLKKLRRALPEFGVLFFRDQVLSPSDHHHFAHRFGSIVRNKFFTALSENPDIATVYKGKNDDMNIGGGWHTDHSYDLEPALGSILVARRLPEQGGDTRFANLIAAYQGLSDRMKQRLAGMRVVHSNVHIYGEDGFYSHTDIAARLGGKDRVGQAIHPVVIRHPESGKKALFVNPGHTIGFEGQTYEESLPLLEELYDHVDQPEFTCQFNWQPGSVAFWDNRATWHFANNDYPGQERLMHRITLAGSALAAES